MTLEQAIEAAITQLKSDCVFPTSTTVANVAREILEKHKLKVVEMKPYDSLSVKRVKMNADPLFKEQHSSIQKLATSTAAEFLSEGRDVWRIFKSNAERNAATIVYNEVRERITRGFK